MYYTASGIITLVGGRPAHRLREDSRLKTQDSRLIVFSQSAHRSANYRCDDTRCFIKKLLTS